MAQNKRFEKEPDRSVRQAALEAAEKDGTRVWPEYGSVWYSMSGKNQSSARLHITIAVPGATTASTGLPDHNEQGGAWIMNAGTSSAHIMVPGSQRGLRSEVPPTEPAQPARPISASRP